MEILDKRVIKLAEHYIQMFEQIKCDVHREKVLKIENFYDLDFSEIYLYMHQRGTKKFKMLDTIFTGENNKYKFILLPPTIFELFKYLEDTGTIIDGYNIFDMPSVKNFNDAYQSYLDDSSTFEKLQYAYENLAPLHNLLFDFHDAPIGKLYDFLMNGNIIEFTQIEKISGEIPKGNSTIYRKVYKELKKHRPTKKANNEIDANTAAIVCELNAKYSEDYFFSIVTSSSIFKKVFEKINLSDSEFLSSTIVIDPLFLYAKSLFNEMAPNAGLDDFNKIISFFKALSSSDDVSLLENIDIYTVHLIKKLFYIDKRWTIVFSKCLIDNDFLERVIDEYSEKSETKRGITFEEIKLAVETFVDKSCEEDILIATKKMKKIVDEMYIELYDTLEKTSYASLTPQITDTYNFIKKRQ